MTTSLREDISTFLIISRSAFLELQIFYTEIVTKIKTNILCSVTLFAQVVLFMTMWKRQ
jgi:hypothetical protein